MAAVVVGTNSWVTIADADAYLGAKYGADAWASFTETVKTSLLITAFNMLRRAHGYNIAASATAQAVKDAQCELAWFWYSHGAEWEKRAGLYAAGVREFDILDFSETLEAPDLPFFIKDMLDDYYVGENRIATLHRDY